MKIVFNYKKIQRLLEDYHLLTGLRIALFDTDLNEIYSNTSIYSNFCEKIRKNSDINEKCNNCDKKAFATAKKLKKLYIYKCHMGLYEAITPLYNRQQILGYVMIGQILDSSNVKAQWEKLLRNNNSLKDTLLSVRDEYSTIQQMSLDEIRAASHILESCSIAIWHQYILDIKRTSVSEQINEYISYNYSEKLSTDIVCKDLDMSKTTIYNTLKEEYNMSLTKYINKYRLDISKKLLLEKTHAISTIAYKVGFDDYNYFSRLFKDTYNITPSEYRKSLNLKS